MEFADSAAEVDAITEAALTTAQELLEGVAAAVDAPSWERVLAPLDRIAATLAEADGRAAFMAQVHPDPDVRAAARTADERLQQWRVAMVFRDDLHAAVEALAAAPEGAALTGERARLLAFVRRDLRLAGHALDPAAREELQRLTGRLVELGVQFLGNLADHDDPLVVTEDDLAGLPAAFVEGLGAGPEPGTRVVTMTMPDVLGVLDQAPDRELRREVDRRWNSRAVEVNRPLLEEAVRLRARIAALFDEPSWAHHKLQDRMADGPEDVTALYDRVVPPLTTAARGELARMQQLLAADTEDPDAVVQRWDWRYYHDRILREEHGVDADEVAAHFPLDAVLDGLLTLTDEVFGLEQVRVELPTWHPEVRSLEVRDRASGEVLAHVHMDLFPREGTFGHAAAFTLTPGRLLPDGEYQRPVSAIVANVTRPVGDRPSLLRHEEVETLFHEYGHILHQVLTRAELARFSGTSVERDFVEAPSQIMEHWTWEPEVLARFARHHATGAPIPEQLVAAMVAARDLDTAVQKLRQVQFGMLDLALHGPDAAELDLTRATREAAAVTLLPPVETTFFPAGWGHVMAGYDAGYYGYLWSEVIGDDLFRRFAEEGVTSPQVGADYRREILEAGGTRDADELVRRFLGREPDATAFLTRLGIG